MHAVSASWLSWRHQAKAPPSIRDALVLYLMLSPDPDGHDNFLFFVKEAVHGDERCDYVFLVHQSYLEVGAASLPA